MFQNTCGMPRPAAGEAGDCTHPGCSRRLSHRPTAVALAALTLLAISSSFVNAAAHPHSEVDGYSGATALAPSPPAGYLANLRPFEVFDDHGNLVRLTLDDVRKYHGHLGPVPVFTWRVLQAATALLWIERPMRGDMQVVSRVPSQCAQDVFELTMRVVTEDAYQVVLPSDATGAHVPGPPVTLSCFAFEIMRKSTGDRVRIQARDGVIPAEFFQGMRSAHAPEKPQAAGARTDFMTMKKDLSKKLAAMRIEDLLTWEVTRGAGPAIAAQGAQ